MRRRLAGWGAALLAVLVAVPVSAALTPAVASAAAPIPGMNSLPPGTRYVDPVFAGALAPVQEASYVPADALNRRQTLTLTGLAGNFTLTVGGQTTAALPASATAAQVQAALATLTATDTDGVAGGDISVTGGPGGLTGGYQFRIAFTGPEPAGGFPEITADGSALVNYPPLVGSAAVQCDHCLDVYQPAEVPPAGGRPAVLILHGGGFTGGNKDGSGNDPNGQHVVAWAGALAERGYVAVPMNYTLADAATLPPTTCDWDGTAGPACGPAYYGAVTTAQHDLQAAVRWLRWTTRPAGEGGLDNPYGIDPNHILVVGESAGGFTAVAAMSKPDDPGTVGITTESSAIQGGTAVAAIARSADIRAGMPPTLLLTFTNDPLAEYFGMDMYDQSRKLVARALDPSVHALVESVGYCRRMATTPGGALQPMHLAPLGTPEFADQVDRTARFLYEHVVGPTPDQDPAAARWVGSSTRTPPVVARPGQVLYGAHQAVRGDFDGDGRDDVLWYGAGSECDTVWFGRADGTFADPKEIVNGTFTPAVDIAGAYTPVTGDFDGDGRDDIAWYDPTTGLSTQLWYGNADGTFTRIDVGAAQPGLTAGSGDFDGDGRSDLLVWAPQVGAVLVAFGSPTRGVFTGGTLLQGLGVGIVPTVGDFDGDGADDVYWSGGSGPALWYGGARASAAGLAAFTTTTAPIPPAGSKAQAADADGDGRDDLVWTAPGAARLWFGSAERGSLVSGPSWMVNSTNAPTLADLNGDGRADLLWSMNTGVATVWYGVTVRSWGFLGTSTNLPVPSGMVPLAGDFDAAASGTAAPIDDVVWAPAPS